MASGIASWETRLTIGAMALYTSFFATNRAEAALSGVPLLQEETYRLALTVFVKAFPIWMLSCWAARMALKGAQGAESVTAARRISWGLLLSSIGDVSLDLDHKAEILFVVGLGSFLLAHLCYVWAFLGTGVRHSAAVALALCGALGGVLYHLVPLIQANPVHAPLIGPVLLYVTVIGTMGYCAAIRTVTSTATYWLSLLGALIFAVSDSILAFDRFHSGAYAAWFPATPTPKILVMITYYAAQFCIGSSTVAAVEAAAGTEKKEETKKDK